MPRYQDIARQLKTAIEQGELKPGARLPSSRTWSQELGVSRSTVENAYAELVAQGWLIRRGQAGTFVSERIYPQQSTVQVVAFAGESQQPLPTVAISNGITRTRSLSARAVGAGDGASPSYPDAL